MQPLPGHPTANHIKERGRRDASISASALHVAQDPIVDLSLVPTRGTPQEGRRHFCEEEERKKKRALFAAHPFFLDVPHRENQISKFFYGGHSRGQGQR
jgi:hypothetical protein